MNRMGPDLVTPYLPCFLRVLGVLDSDGENVESAAALRDELFTLLNAASESAAETSTPQTISLARRIAEAWCDERLATDPWRHREDWLPNPLQSDWGEGRQAGDWIFDKLAALDPSRSDHAGLAALALRCLALGFKGRMDATPKDLAKLRKDLADQFGLSSVAAPFPPEVKVECVAAAGKARHVGRTAACLLLGVALLGAGWWLAGWKLDSLVASIVAAP